MSAEEQTSFDEKTKLKMTVRVFVGIILGVIGFVTQWLTLVNGQREMNARLDSIIEGQKTFLHTDDLARFGDKLTIANPTLHIIVPEQSVWARPSELAHPQNQN